MGNDELADRVRDGFLKAFWISPFRGLRDVVTSKHKDESIRPNQIFAASLPHSPLDADQQRAVVEVVRRELLTPFGLRTLARTDRNYIGRYTGGPMQRDRAYHNGTVWAWLIGPFLEGYLKSHERAPDALRQARVWLQPLIDHMNNGCIGQISECFEGDEPHRPVGAPAQAWSVAETLRIAVQIGI
jgi:glycogen debranching enzyme